jgi:hypothetical protein
MLDTDGSTAAEPISDLRHFPVCPARARSSGTDRFARAAAVGYRLPLTWANVLRSPHAVVESAPQADSEGSIPFTRSVHAKPAHASIPNACWRNRTCSRNRFSATASCGVMCVTPVNGNTVCGRPFSVSRCENNNVLAATTLSSARP